MRLTLFGGFSFGKLWRNIEKTPFFGAAMAGFGKYCKGGCGWIGVYRVRIMKTRLYYTKFKKKH